MFKECILCYMKPKTVEGQTMLEIFSIVGGLLLLGFLLSKIPGATVKDATLAKAHVVTSQSSHAPSSALKVAPAPKVSASVKVMRVSVPMDCVPSGKEYRCWFVNSKSH